ncbi:VWA domain-containing protein, partial [Candidatus Woesearchaeota archaeon]|nr:VWA domain-containing protein [Candidatus Woesearchaeota archaeon]
TKREFPTLEEMATENGRNKTFFELYIAKVIASQHKGELDPAFSDQVDQLLSQKVTSDALQKEGYQTLGQLLDKLVDVSVFERIDDYDACVKCMDATKEAYRLYIEEFKDIPRDKNGKPSRGKGRGSKHGKGKVKVGSDKELKEKEGEIRKAAKKLNEDLKKAKAKADKEKKENEQNSELEYDYQRKVYSKSVRVVDEVATEKNFKFLNELERYRPVIDLLAGHLEELKPNQWQLVQGVNEPDMLNMECVLEVMADPKLAVDGRIYDSMEINIRDDAFAILVDRSGSTSHKINGSTVLDLEKYFAGILYKALTEYDINGDGDDVSMYTYDSDDFHGNIETRITKIEGLEELGAIKPRGANRDGAAIRRVTRKVMEKNARRKWLIIVADGQPAASDYDGKYAVADTAKSIAEAEEKGVNVIYLNIQETRPDYFAKLTSNATYARWFTDPKELPLFGYDLITDVMR